MTANELRIGNSFTYGKGENIDTVYQITFDRQDGHLVNGNIPVKDCSGIPLSPEVLESCGFREGTVEGFYYLDIGNDVVFGLEDNTFHDEDKYGEIDADNYAYCSDDELGEAPINPKTYEEIAKI